MHPPNIHPVLQRLVLHQQGKVLSPAPKPWRPFQLLTCLLQWTGRKNVPHEHCRALVHIHPTGLHAGSEWLGWAPVPQPANTPFLPFFPFFWWAAGSQTALSLLPAPPAAPGHRSATGRVGLWKPKAGCRRAAGGQLQRSKALFLPGTGAAPPGAAQMRQCSFCYL